jgi:hypothetical protein
LNVPNVFVTFCTLSAGVVINKCRLTEVVISCFKQQKILHTCVARVYFSLR